MKKEVLVSVVIPCFKCSTTISRALDSILDQTASPLEVILVDDNGDASEMVKLSKVFESYKSLFTCSISLLSYGENKGAPSARNFGWSRSCGEYIAFLDADDAWHPKKLETQYFFMKKNKDAVLSGHSISILKPDCLPSLLATIPSKIPYSLCSKASILMRNRLPTPTWMVQKTCQLRFNENMKCVDDHLFLMTLALNGATVMRIECELAFVFKEMFGSSGLSGSLFRMEKYELKAYYQILALGKINVLSFVFFVALSLLKFTRRCMVTPFRKLINLIMDKQ